MTIRRFRRQLGVAFPPRERTWALASPRRHQPSDDDPSSKTVWSELARLADCVNETLVDDEAYGPSIPTVVEVTYTHEGRSVLHLNLFSRRLVVSSQTEDLAQVFEACHQDGVSGFAAVRTPEMHEFWKRTR